jgi:hypothetical protein
MDSQMATLVDCNKKPLSGPKIQNGILFPCHKGREEVDESHNREGGDFDLIPPEAS